jgi:hypothetical protein
MEVYVSLQDAREGEAERKVPFIEIRRIADDEWHAYETVDELPPEPQS